MADTAAFFAKKKKGKKGFKSFNANKIDVSSVIPTTHVDAPEVERGVAEMKVDDGWADSHTSSNGNGAGTTGVWGAAAGGEKVAELLDMQTLKNQDMDVAERLRIEETKAQLARAKEGMAKEAERIEKEKKEKEEKAAARQMGVVSEGGAGGGSGKWVPSHLRGGGSSIRGPAVMGGVKQPNVADEELFPDLAAADKILAEKKEKQEKIAVGGGGGIRAPSGWGNRGPGGGAAASSRQPLNLAPRTEERKPLNLAPPTNKKEEEAVVAAAPEKEEKKEEADVAAPAPDAVVPEEKTEEAPKKDIKLKKKKKKDLSSFKPSS